MNEHEWETRTLWPSGRVVRICPACHLAEDDPRHDPNSGPGSDECWGLPVESDEAAE